MELLRSHFGQSSGKSGVLASCDFNLPPPGFASRVAVIAHDPDRFGDVQWTGEHFLTRMPQGQEYRMNG